MPTVDWQDFFANRPAEKLCNIVAEGRRIEQTNPISGHCSVPRIKLHCPTSSCDGLRNFDPSPENLPYSEASRNSFIDFTCADCTEFTKTFSLNLKFDAQNKALLVFKYGEQPPFRLVVPPKILELLEVEKELFFKGLGCESEGYGIGAFTYYRRVIERQKDEIFQEIIRVVKEVRPDDPVLMELEEARKEQQFARSIEKIKHALPDSLIVKGHNPLTLLHKALSEGLHNESDRDCLELATDIRLVLVGFVDRMHYALKEENELIKAVGRLTEQNSKK